MENCSNFHFFTFFSTHFNGPCSDIKIFIILFCSKFFFKKIVDKKPASIACEW